VPTRRAKHLFSIATASRPVRWFLADTKNGPILCSADCETCRDNNSSLLPAFSPASSGGQRNPLIPSWLRECANFGCAAPPIPVTSCGRVRLPVNMRKRQSLPSRVSTPRKMAVNMLAFIQSRIGQGELTTGLNRLSHWVCLTHLYALFCPAGFNPTCKRLSDRLPPGQYLPTRGQSLIRRLGEPVHNCPPPDQ
jgi:hypothetical protein